jgi:gamma-glutamylcyclotransferase (GGCT)/AIG2-like uncharacterized protein YtfP
MIRIPKKSRSNFLYQKMPEYIFVYGSIKSTFEPDTMFQSISEMVKIYGSGKFKADLYLIEEGYPAMILNPDSDIWVQGEILEILDHVKLLPILDRYEGYIPGNTFESEYVREKIDVMLPDNTTLSCWSYIYVDAIDYLSLIPSGLVNEKLNFQEKDEH